VVVGTDFSEPAALAVKAGAREARARGVHLVLVHSVFQPDPLAMLGPTVASNPLITEDQRAVVSDAAEQLLSTLLESTGAAGSTQVAAGEPGRSIVSAAEVSGAELVVVATHGRTGVARLALGSVAEFVVKRAPCSVLVVRPEG
jgi:nucleotide-binding universal stress UspA family protein